MFLFFVNGISIVKKKFQLVTAHIVYNWTNFCPQYRRSFDIQRYISNYQHAIKFQYGKVLSRQNLFFFFFFLLILKKFIF